MTALHIRFGAVQGLPLNVLLSAIPSLPRPMLDRLVTRAIERMDEIDGDPDLEPNGDEIDGTNAEDEALYAPHGLPLAYGPGCPISDAGGGNVEDEPQGLRDPHA